jgi:hypothetical protein
LGDFEGWNLKWERKGGVNLITWILGKTTWQGCGSHVPNVMDNVPKEEWCGCTPQVEKEGKKYPPGKAR